MKRALQKQQLQQYTHSTAHSGRQVRLGKGKGFTLQQSYLQAYVITVSYSYYPSMFIHDSIEGRCSHRNMIKVQAICTSQSLSLPLAKHKSGKIEEEVHTLCPVSSNYFVKKADRSNLNMLTKWTMQVFCGKKQWIIER